MSIFVCLFLPSHFSIIILCFSSYFHPLLLVLNFHFFFVSSFLSVIFVYLFFFLLVSSSFHVSFLVTCSWLFPCLFLFPVVFHLSQTLRFSPYFYIVLLLPFSVSFSRLLFFFHYIIFLGIFSLDDSQDTQTYTLHTQHEICTAVMQTFCRELTTAK